MENKRDEIILKMRSIIKTIGLLEQNITQLKLEINKIRLSLIEEKNDRTKFNL